MRTVFLTIGPRGAGKSTFCREVVAHRPDVTLLQRDAILVEFFGSTMLSPYEGGHAWAMHVLFERLERALVPENATVILDTWNGLAGERRELVRVLRNLGADEVIGWYFVTPEETVVRQFLEREGETALAAWGARAESYCRRDFTFFHAQEVSTDQGFDEIIRIDPTQLWLFSPAYVLLPPPRS